MSNCNGNAELPEEVLAIKAMANRQRKSLLVGKYGRLDQTAVMLDSLRTSSNSTAMLHHLVDFLAKLTARRIEIEHKRNKFEPGNRYWEGLQAVLGRIDVKIAGVEDMLLAHLQQRIARREVKP